MASTHQTTGMTGVYLVAAELCKRGLIASPTSRSAKSADLLVNDTDCQRFYAVEVKTNSRPNNFWLMSAKAQNMISPSLIYAFVNLRKDKTEFYLVPSKAVATNILVEKPTRTRKTAFYSIYREKIEKYKDNWEIFNK